MRVVLEKKDFGKVLVEVLKALAFVKKDALFGYTVFEALQSKLGYYITTRKIKVVNQIILTDPHPLQSIGTVDKFSFVMHHFVSEAK